MVSTNDIRPGQSILVDNTLYLILEYQHVKPGKGKAFVKTKLKNLSSGGVLDKTFRADEDVQQAFIDAGAVQCGFCTPGLLVTIDDLLEKNENPDDLTVREAISGNLCRCTGYGRILEAVQIAAASRRGEKRE